MKIEVWSKEGMEESRWVDSLRAFCLKPKVGYKRTMYNQLNKLKHQAEAIASRDIIARNGTKWFELQGRSLRAGMNRIRSMIIELELFKDEDVFKKAASIFKGITVREGRIEADLGRLELTWQGSTYYIGIMGIVFNLDLDGQDRVRVFNTDTPAEADMKPHPHVSSDHKVCYGTWKDMINNLGRQRWSWLRVMVLTAEFLEYYTPEGGPYMKLSAGWKGRLIGGPARCATCERVVADCSCIRGEITCPKTREILRMIPETNGYCNGCQYYVPFMVGILARPSCTFPLPARVEGRGLGEVSVNPEQSTEREEDGV